MKSCVLCLAKGRYVGRVMTDDNGNAWFTTITGSTRGGRWDGHMV